MKRWIIPLCLVGLVVAIPGDAQASDNACKLDGVWYGYNDYPHDYIMTITKTGGGEYTAVVMNAEGGNAQGEFVFKRRGEYETTWMTYVDAGDGTWYAIYMYGDAVMDSCNSWSALTTWDLYQFEPGTGDDALAEENFLFSLGEFTLTYQRMP